MGWLKPTPVPTPTSKLIWQQARRLAGLCKPACAPPVKRTWLQFVLRRAPPPPAQRTWLQFVLRNAPPPPAQRTWLQFVLRRAPPTPPPAYSVEQIVGGVLNLAKSNWLSWGLCAASYFPVTAPFVSAYYSYTYFRAGSYLMGTIEAGCALAGAGVPLNKWFGTLAGKLISFTQKASPANKVMKGAAKAAGNTPTLVKAYNSITGAMSSLANAASSTSVVQRVTSVFTATGAAKEAKAAVTVTSKVWNYFGKLVSWTGGYLKG